MANFESAKTKNRILTSRHKKALLFLVFCLMILVFGQVLAAANNIADVVTNIQGSFPNIGRLMVAISYMVGIGFLFASVFKMKQHRDNPTQIPVGAPIALMAIAVIMIFLPGIVKPIGETFFGVIKDEEAGGFSGAGAVSSELPGASEETDI